MLGIYVADDVRVQSDISHDLLDAVGKLGGDGYAYTRETTALARP